jgi:hypothetical protein
MFDRCVTIVICDQTPRFKYFLLELMGRCSVQIRTTGDLPLSGMRELFAASPILPPIKVVELVAEDDDEGEIEEVGWLPSTTCGEKPSEVRGDFRAEETDGQGSHDDDSGAIAGYFVEELLGTGSFARVYLGCHPDKCVRVAIKQASSASIGYII